MEFSVKQKRKVNDALLITSSAIVISLIYPIFADGFGEVIPYVNSFFIGLTGGLLVSLIELEIFETGKRKLPFLQSFFIKTTSYFLFFLIIIPSIMGFIESVYYGQGFLEHIKSEQFLEFIYKEDYIIILFYALFFIALINFTRLISRKLGQGTLVNYITGRYHRPKEVERIFMYLDLRSSTAIAEKLGVIKYHKFLKEFFNDITECIVSTRGIIYRYVADEIVVSWKMKEGLQNANCIKTHSLIKNKIRNVREKYLVEYDTIPTFTSCFHCGKVVIGEIGDVKSQIVYHGEILYELAKIEKKCKELNESLLISEPLIQLIPLPSLYKMVKVTEIKKTANKTMDLYTLKEIAQ